MKIFLAIATLQLCSCMSYTKTDTFSHLALFGTDGDRIQTKDILMEGYNQSTTATAAVRAIESTTNLKTVVGLGNTGVQELAP